MLTVLLRIQSGRDTAPAGTQRRQGHSVGRDTAPAGTQCRQGHSASKIVVLVIIEIVGVDVF
jgi:hypothetical protein